MCLCKTGTEGKRTTVLREEKIKWHIDFSLDELQALSYDNGWNAVIDELNRCIAEKSRAKDEKAVEILTWARNKIADLEGEDE